MNNQQVGRQCSYPTPTPCSRVHAFTPEGRLALAGGCGEASSSKEPKVVGAVCSRAACENLPLCLRMPLRCGSRPEVGGGLCSTVSPLTNTFPASAPQWHLSMASIKGKSRHGQVHHSCLGIHSLASFYCCAVLSCSVLPDSENPWTIAR